MQMPQLVSTSASETSSGSTTVVLATQPLESLNFNLKAIVALIDQLQFEAQPREVTTARTGLLQMESGTLTGTVCVLHLGPH